MTDPIVPEFEEWIVRGTPESVKPILMEAARFRTDTHSFFGNERAGGGVRPNYLLVFAEEHRSSTTQNIAIVNVYPFPGERSRIVIQPNEPAPATQQPLLAAYSSMARSKLLQHGLVADSTRFESYGVLQTARRELDAAEDATAFANIGNSCRAALKALSNEIWAVHMVPTGQRTPPIGDAKTKLRQALYHYFAGRAENYRTAVFQIIKGVWDLSASLTHRHEHATREEAEVCLKFVEALFEAFSFIVPQNP